jgi:hypothetical protein
MPAVQLLSRNSAAVQHGDVAFCRVRLAGGGGSVLEMGALEGGIGDEGMGAFS